MRAHPEVEFTLESRRRTQHATAAAASPPPESKDAGAARVARLMALAIRLDGLIRTGAIRDYAEAARRGRVTRARVTQIMKLLDLAPDIQEAILSKLLAQFGFRIRGKSAAPIGHNPRTYDERCFASTAIQVRRNALFTSQEYAKHHGPE